MVEAEMKSVLFHNPGDSYNSPINKSILIYTLHQDAATFFFLILIILYWSIVD